MAASSPQDFAMPWTISSYAYVIKCPTLQDAFDNRLPQRHGELLLLREGFIFFSVSFVLTNTSWPSSFTVLNLGSWFQVFWGNNETNLIYSLAKQFCNDFRVHPWAHRFRKARVRYEVGVWSSTEDVPGEVIFIKVDIPGAYVASSCEVLSWVQDALSHWFLDNGQQCCHTGFNQLDYVISLIGLRRAGWLLVGLPYATTLRCGSRPG